DHRTTGLQDYKSQAASSLIPVGLVRAAAGHNSIDFAVGFRSFLLVKLQFKHLDLHLAHTWTISRTGGSSIAKVVVVELTGADGTVGRGEAAPVARYKESVKTVQAFLE